MQKLVVILCFLFMIQGLFGQVAERFNYQAVVRDNAGMIVTNQIVSLQLAILQDSPNGQVKFIENHLVSTNQFGLIKLEVGGGSPVNGSWNTIEWASHDHFIRVSIDINGGNNFQFLGTSQLLSVPYAKVSERAVFDNVEDADSNPTNEIQTLSITGNQISISSGNTVTLLDNDVSNEIQDLSLNNDTLFISGSNYVVLPSAIGNLDDQNLELNGNELGIESGNIVDLSVFLDNTDAQTLSISGNELSISGGNSISIIDNVDDADNDVLNELQDITLINDSIGLSNSNAWIDLSNYKDNTDEQELHIQGDTLSISGGNWVVLPSNGNGQNDSNQSLILVNDSLSIEGGNPISLSDYLDNTDNQNLSLDGSNLVIENGNSVDLSPLAESQFESNGNVVVNSGSHSNNDFVFGAPSLNQNGNFNHFAKFLFDKSRNGAFRAGYIQNDRWNADSLGYASFAAGYNTKASADYSTAFGRDVIVEGTNSFSAGRQNKALGFASIALGFDAVASANYSFAGGNMARAEGINSFAFGENVNAGGINSIAFGKNATAGTDAIAMGSSASADHASAIALGRNTLSDLTGAIAIGENVNAYGSRSVGLGYNLNAPSYGETVIGYNNTNYSAQSASLINADDRLFTVGNGSNSSNLSDAFIIYKDGDAFLAGSVVTNSDKRLKRNIEPVKGSLESLLGLNAYHYQWNDLTPRDTLQLNTGLIAQEVEHYFPELVRDGVNGYKSVNYIGLIPHLIEAVKSQAKHIEELERTLSTQDQSFGKLSAEIEILKKKIEMIEGSNSVGLK